MPKQQARIMRRREEKTIRQDCPYESTRSFDMKALRHNVKQRSEELCRNGQIRGRSTKDIIQESQENRKRIERKMQEHKEWVEQYEQRRKKMAKKATEINVFIKSAAERQEKARKKCDACRQKALRKLVDRYIPIETIPAHERRMWM